jgi:hypothetical protein
MVAKKPRKPRIEAKIDAGIIATAKASFERKKVVTEIIPEDVTRAKAGRWLDLISPITEWAGLKGDALRHRRDLLRIQQEGALVALASAIQSKASSGDIIHPLPPKILVPALEAASLESADSPLIDWWADLLVSGATNRPLRPYLVELMRQIGSEEARFLETIWKAVSKYYRDQTASELPGVVTRMSVVGEIGNVVNRQSNSEKEPWAEQTSKLIAELSSRLILDAERNGVPIRLTLYLPSGGGITWPTSPILSKMKAAIDVSRALNVVQFNGHSESLTSISGNQFRYDIQLLEFSALGVDFMNACRPRERKRPES